MKNIQFKIKSYMLNESHRKQTYNREFVIPFSKEELSSGEFDKISLYKVCAEIFNEFNGNVPYEIVKNLKLISVQDCN